MFHFFKKLFVFLGENTNCLVRQHRQTGLHGSRLPSFLPVLQIRDFDPVDHFPCFRSIWSLQQLLRNGMHWRRQWEQRMLQLHLHVPLASKQEKRCWFHGCPTMVELCFGTHSHSHHSAHEKTHQTNRKWLRSKRHFSRRLHHNGGTCSLIEGRELQGRTQSFDRERDFHS